MKILEKLKTLDIKLLILDVDGVLTDGKVYFFNDGMEAKAFNTRDGFGLRTLLNNNIEVAVISGRKSQATANRMQDLGIKHVYLGIKDKNIPFTELKNTLGLENENIAYVGDDLPDVPIMQQVGFSIAVADAVSEVRIIADYTVTATGGNGAVREACDIILAAKFS